STHQNNWDHGPTFYLRGRTHPSTPTGNIDSTRRIHWNYGSTLFSCFYHNTDFKIVTVIPVFGA
ncbi:hypothetical protein M5Y46_25335, partial [Escherichia coli]|nr:hypothetical protein [Escherichia coli]